MSEVLARKKKVRAGHRASATRIINQLEADRTIDEGVTLDRLQQSKLMLQEKLDTLNVLDQEILALVEDSALEDEIEQADVFKERLQQSLITTDRLIILKNAVPIAATGGPHPRTTTATESRSEAVVTTTTSAILRSDPAVEGSGGMVKLPKLVPRKFNGDLTKWGVRWSLLFT